MSRRAIEVLATANADSAVLTQGGEGLGPSAVAVAESRTGLLNKDGQALASHQSPRGAP
ncbi:hypothetical protein [Mycobacterium gastri]|uniref:hypothetical protein n=1 Tax=Mycobacterium gastri TaxID=1777 RepID=UPI0004AF1B00|nr:hypothetical protein [Mycobacterium gastri]